MVPSFFMHAAATTSSSSQSSPSGQHSPGKYGELLAVIEELGKDIRPTYAGSRNAAERLKKGEHGQASISRTLFSFQTNHLPATSYLELSLFQERHSLTICHAD